MCSNKRSRERERNRVREAREPPFRWHRANGNKKLTELSELHLAVPLQKYYEIIQVRKYHRRWKPRWNTLTSRTPLGAAGENPVFEIHGGFVFPRFQRTEKKHAGPGGVRSSHRTVTRPLSRISHIQEGEMRVAPRKISYDVLPSRIWNRHK